MTLAPIFVLFSDRNALLVMTHIWDSCNVVMASYHFHFVRTDSIFGGSLHELVETDGSLVPKFILYFIDHIEQNGLDVVGLYRLSGNAAMVQKLRFLVEKSESGGEERTFFHATASDREQTILHKRSLQTFWKFKEE